ncbi:uncharacterized protein LOC122255830 isoform X2 [Penaeus japonicus]|uniref:uncharacterized protein LOC122255830 isoform X2 n=1 Tax=Penaeus japonicus TaxID=27405 RepID=UPI001C70C75A|nr:uncharacterized protein LOC122255830 isoform X2 [Penaeus japonicus]
MAVEARVSVQAMKGRFEQLHEDGPLPANPSPTPRVSTSPLRLRSASVSGQVASSSALQQDRKPSERFLDTREEVKKHLSSRPAKADEGHKNKSFLAGFVSPAFMGSRGLRASSSSPKKNFKRIGTSELNLVERRPEDEVDTPLRRVSDGNGAGGKPSVVRRIPVFKSVEGGLDNNKGEEAGSALNGALGDHERKKVIGHGRSRSHGNFIITRDLGGDKDVSAGDKSNSSVVVKAKENIWNKDVIVKALRQKSSDNLFNNRDSRSDYSFEGKQKLVATVVKNMRNKEKPNVLRKFSFTSKTEKDLKNKKEKAVSPAKKDKQQVLPAASPDKKHKWKDRDQKTDKTFTSVKKIEIKAAYPSPDGKTSPTSVNLVTSDAVIATAAIAKAVADIAASKSEINVAESSESASPPVSSSPPDPPARPPRRRTGFTPRKKGRAPSPPGPPGEAPQTHRHTLSEDEGSPSHFQAEARKSVDIHETRMLAEIQLSDGIHPDGFKEAHLLSTDRHKSSDSLATSKVSDRSRQSSPVMAPDNSPVWVKRTSVSSLGSSRGTSPVEGNVGAASKSENKTVAHDMKIYIHDSDQQTTYKYEEGPRSPNPYQDECTSDSKFDFSENAEPEGLPPGPPPKKPPRTFAYDIYRNSKVSRNAGEAMEGADSVGENSVSSNEKLNASPEPVYAVPVKKKKSDKKLDIKPPIRSNSDLTKRELVKPSVAPKPPHIVTKAKRASMVDPLSCPEKDEEAAMTSEFQRQAHIRYSLRRPKKPPPAPPQNAEAEGATSQDLGSSNDVTRARANSRVNLNCSYNSLESQEGHLIHPHARSCTSSPQDLNYSVASDVELSPTSKSFSSGHSIGSNDSDHLKSPVAALRQTSHSTYNLRTTSPMEGDDQPTSLIHCPTASPTALSGLFRKRSMSDETLYKGARHGEEPIYATPIFPNNKGSSGHSRQRELHYMEADGGRDGSRCRRNSRGGGGGAESSADGNKGRAGIISVWKREFRQSCRHVQNKIKKTVIR